MRLVTMNVCDNPPMPQRHVLSDFRLARRLGGIILFQEIEDERYKVGLRSRLGRGWQIVHLDLAIPIAFRTRYFRLVDQGRIRTHHGKAGTSPDRYIAWVVLEDRRTGKRFAVVNSHFVSGAWSGKPNKVWRQAMWRLHYAILRDLVRRLLAQGYTVLGGGDYNRTRVRAFDPSQRSLASSGIDHLWVVEAPTGVHVTVRSTMRVQHGHFTDHDPRVADLALH